MIFFLFLKKKKQKKKKHRCCVYQFQLSWQGNEFMYIVITVIRNTSKGSLYYIQIVKIQISLCLFSLTMTFIVTNLIYSIHWFCKQATEVLISLLSFRHLSERRFCLAFYLKWNYFVLICFILSETMSFLFLSFLCICKSYSHFFRKNTGELDIVLTRTVNILTTNKLIKLTMLWTTGPSCF